MTSFFVERFARQLGKQGIAVAQETVDVLTQYDWPGNVRELENAIEHACTMGSGPVLYLGDMPTQLKLKGLEAQRAAAAAGENNDGPAPPELKTLAEREREAILEAIRMLNGDKLRAAKALGIGKTTLYRKLKEYGIADPMHEE